MTRTLLATDQIAVTMHRYQPGEKHGLHTDLNSRLSLLLQGGYREDGKTGAIQMRPGDLLFKSRRAKHEDVFGHEGAEVLSVQFTGDDPFDASADPACWRKRTDGFTLRHAAAFLEAASARDARSVETTTRDLISDTANAPASERNAPAWLEQLRDEVEISPLADVDVAARSKAAGVHPSQASRLFRRCYGASITEHAQAHAVRRAMTALCGDGSLSDVAVAVGFYDQSHMSRVFRRLTGRTPGAFRRVCAA